MSRVFAYQNYGEIRMKINCCSRAVLEFEIKNRLRHLEKEDSIEFKIVPCEILSGTFDLLIYSENQATEKSQ